MHHFKKSSDKVTFFAFLSLLGFFPEKQRKKYIPRVIWATILTAGGLYYKM